MKNYIKADEWNIIEEGFNPQLHQISESIFSIGNGRMGQRANFEEQYTGQHLQGNYIAGVYYPDKTRVGWWKNGYPDYFAKVLNAANWMGLDIRVAGEVLDLNLAQVTQFKRVLNMKAGYLERSFTAELKSGKRLAVKATRFYSIVNDDLAALKYEITPLNFEGLLSITSFIDGDVKNQDANDEENFWDEVAQLTEGQSTFLTLKTKKTAFEVCTGTTTTILHQNENVVLTPAVKREKYIGLVGACIVKQGEHLCIYKYATNISSMNVDPAELQQVSAAILNRASEKGFQQLLEEQAAAWQSKWEKSDILIEGDVAAQQAIRFNIFQLNQTYTGKDERLNIGPKGFTGEKYGGSTYWDTEAYCIPFYLATAPAEVAKNLLIYRYKHLEKAIENAVKLGFNQGAALYPMVTMNGEECHNEWEITFEEIHRNGAIAFAIFNYIRYTGDQDYLKDFGLEVLIAIARFWKQRVNWSADKNKFVILGVTGPNEYENNINNNWYTNTIAVWCLNYAMEAAKYVAQAHRENYALLVEKTNLQEEIEFADWKNIAQNMYFPYDEKLGIFLQQDGYLDKEQVLATDLPAEDRPLNQKWSWDRILRSCFIKQADVLQGLYFFEDNFDLDTLRRNFNFYEPRTVHESSLSPCIHSILASRLNKGQKAYDLYLRTARLDLDDYNKDTEDGLHITSMAGTWMSIVEGFAGMKVRNNLLHFSPILPQQWQSFSFNINFRAAKLTVKVTASHIMLFNHAAEILAIQVFDELHQVPQGEKVISLKVV